MVLMIVTPASRERRCPRHVTTAMERLGACSETAKKNLRPSLVTTSTRRVAHEAGQLVPLQIKRPGIVGLELESATIQPERPPPNLSPLGSATTSVRGWAQTVADTSSRASATAARLCCSCTIDVSRAITMLYINARMAMPSTSGCAARRLTSRASPTESVVGLRPRAFHESHLVPPTQPNCRRTARSRCRRFTRCARMLLPASSATSPPFRPDSTPGATAAATDARS